MSAPALDSAAGASATDAPTRAAVVGSRMLTLGIGLAILAAMILNVQLDAVRVKRKR